MGFIKLSSFRPPEDCTSSTSNEVHPSQHANNAVHNESMRTENHAMKQDRIEPKYVQDCDLPFISAAEVAKRDGKVMDDIWVVVDKVVLDVTGYIGRHPGGRQIILAFAGSDCSWQWWTFHNRQVWRSIASGLRVGRTEGVDNPYERPAQRFERSKLGLEEWE
ncbi:hypothetical protein AC578_7959 [Pseudocercospora eumusae]|uniref:Cytochrome b5 heme-binding domain-containing protein n=1 Tax=Pseudocercospora eumusae TaxID=321146 RepID=A0A139HP95_9PEZI|nr:hypothetical protein AC578_7959 [Pseudocercospora eumusae]